MSKAIFYLLINERDIEHLCISIRLVRRLTRNTKNEDIVIRVYYSGDYVCSDTLKRLKKLDPNIELLGFKNNFTASKEVRPEYYNSDIGRFQLLEDSEFDITLYLDNDIYVVAPEFFGGFDIAANFGILFVENPRQFISSPDRTGDLDIGVSVSQYDRQYFSQLPKCMTSVNAGVIFKSNYTIDWIDHLEFCKLAIQEIKEHPSRGPVIIGRVMWKHQILPYILPAPWLLCGGMVDCVSYPLALHMNCEKTKYLWENRYSKLLD